MVFLEYNSLILMMKKVHVVSLEKKKCNLWGQYHDMGVVQIVGLRVRSITRILAKIHNFTLP